MGRAKKKPAPVKAKTESFEKKDLFVYFENAAILDKILARAAEAQQDFQSLGNFTKEDGTHKIQSSQIIHLLTKPNKLVGDSATSFLDGLLKGFKYNSGIAAKFSNTRIQEYLYQYLHAQKERMGNRKNLDVSNGSEKSFDPEGFDNSGGSEAGELDNPGGSEAEESCEFEDGMDAKGRTTLKPLQAIFDKAAYFRSLVTGAAKSRTPQEDQPHEPKEKGLGSPQQGYEEDLQRAGSDTGQEGSIKKIQDQISNLTQRNTELRGKMKEISRLERDTKTKTDENKACKEDLQRAGSDTGQEGSIKKLQDQISNLTQRNTELGEKMKEISCLKSDIKTKTDENNACKEEISRLKRDIKTKTDENNARQAANSTKIAELQSEIAELQREFADYAHLERESNADLAKIAAKEETNNALQSRVTELEGLIPTHEAQQTTNSKKIADLQRKIAAKEETNNALQSRVTELEGLIPTHEAQQTTNSKKIADLQSEITDYARFERESKAVFQREIAAKEETNNALQSRVTELEGLITDLQREIAEKCEENSHVKGELTRIQGELTCIQGEYDRFKRESNDQLGKIAAMEREIANLRRTIPCAVAPAPVSASSDPAVERSLRQVKEIFLHQRMAWKTPLKLWEEMEPSLRDHFSRCPNKEHAVRVWAGILQKQAALGIGHESG